MKHVALLLAVPQGRAQTATLSGTVRDHREHPIAGATVEVLANDGLQPPTVIDSTVADASGGYAVELDRIGIHFVRVRIDSTERGLSTVIPLYLDRLESVRADLVFGPAETVTFPGAPLRLVYADPASRPARLAQIFDYAGAEAVEAPPPHGFEDAVLVQSLSEASDEARLRAGQATAALNRIPMGSPAWMATGDDYLLLRTIDATGTPEAYADYVEQFAAEQPDPLPVAGVVYEALGRARLAGDDERIERYLALVRERMAVTYWGSRALAEFAADRAVRPGEPVPAFAFPELDGSGVITPDDLAGRVYLIDFWATWCRPCVAERDEFAALYEAHRDRGFEIVSVSFDLAPDDVDFERWPMPWRHAYFEPTSPEAEAVADVFALGALPKAVLVGRDGCVIAGGVELSPEVVGRLLPDALD